MIPFNNGNSEIEYLDNPNVTVAEVKSILKGIKGKYLVVIDDQSRFVKLAFKQDIEDIKVGAAISTYPGWQERVAANIEAGVDLIAVDTSDAFNVFVGELLKEYKETEEFEGVPICAGNVVTYKGVRYLIESGADMVKLGMSSGSICSTKREKAVGRAPVAAFLEADRARMDWHDWSGKYVPLIWDGGAASAADWNIALTVIDAVMCGGYLNHFYEAAAEKYDVDGKVTTDEAKMVAVATWGEGSARGINMDRYGQSRRTFFTEGEEGTVPYLGRMKPNLEMDLNKAKAALSNAGCKNLYEFQQKSVIAVMSLAAQGIVGDTHSMKPK
jgi:IMP dehydrogenase